MPRNADQEEEEEEEREGCDEEEEEEAEMRRVSVVKWGEGAGEGGGEGGMRVWAMLGEGQQVEGWPQQCCPAVLASCPFWR